MGIPKGYDVDRIFKLAGFPYGKPVSPPPDTFIETGVNSWDILVNLFDDKHLDYITDHVVSRSVDIPSAPSVNPIFEHLLAAEILSALTDAGYTPLGRSFDTVSFNLGGVTENFVDGDVVRAKQTRQIRYLRSRATNLYGKLQSSTVSTAFRDSEIDLRDIEKLVFTFDTVQTDGVGSQSVKLGDIQLPKGAYIGDISFDTNADLDNTRVGFSIWLQTPDKEWQLLYPVRTTGSMPLAVHRKPVVILVETDGVSTVSVYCTVSNPSAVITISNTVLTLYQLWGIGANDGSASDIPDNSVTLAKLSELVADRLLPTPVGADDQILRVDGNTLGYEDLPPARVGAGAISLANLADAVAGRLLPTPIGNDDQILRVSGTTLGYENLPPVTIPDGSIDLDALASAVSDRLLAANAGGVLNANLVAVRNALGNIVWAKIGNAYLDTATQVRIPPTPSGQDDGRILVVSNDALAYADAPMGSGGGGFPTTRTQLFTANVNTSNVLVTPSEAIAHNTLYEVVWRNFRYYVLSNATGSFFTFRWVIESRSNSPSLGTSPYLQVGGRYNPDVLENSVTCRMFQYDNGEGAIPVTFNKLS